MAEAALGDWDSAPTTCFPGSAPLRRILRALRPFSPESFGVSLSGPNYARFHKPSGPKRISRWQEAFERGIDLSFVLESFFVTSFIAQDCLGCIDGPLCFKGTGLVQAECLGDQPVRHIALFCPSAL